MPLYKADKIKLVEDYKKMIQNAKWIVVFSYDKIPVNEINMIRKDMYKLEAIYKVIKKRIFLRAIKEVGYEQVWEDILTDAVSVLFMPTEDIQPLKKIDNYKKAWKKERKEYIINYIGWWFEGKWQWVDYVNVLATLPSKEELISKAMYMFKYPIQGFVSVNSNILSSFVRVLDQIKDKK